MSERNIGQEILDGIQEIKSYKTGSGNLLRGTLKEPAPVSVIREKLGASQGRIAELMGASTLRTFV